MKILFVDNSSDLQQKWIEPLRKKGWGVVRARSVEDAARMMVLHSDSLEAIAVSEKLVSFAEKQELPFVVLTTQWGEKEIQKHKSGSQSAIAYLSQAKGMEELFSIFEGQGTQALKATGTDGQTRGIALEDYSDILTRPEKTSTSLNLKLAAPTIVLGGGAFQLEEEEAPKASETKLSLVPPIEEPAPALEVEEVQAIDFSSDAPDGATVMLDTTKFNDEESIGIDLLSEPQAAPEIEALPEVDSFEGSLSLAPDESEGSELPEIGVDMDLGYESALSAAQSIPMNSPVNQFSIDPSPSAQVSDLSTLKSYLALREQDVAVLTGQVRSSQERLQQLEMMLKMEKAKNTELSNVVSKQEQVIKNYDQDKKAELEVFEKHAEDLQLQLKDRTDKVRSIEAKLKITTDEVNKIKDRVRVDIRRIRVREKELESQLEILKKDSAALIQARDEKVLELKRKVDLLEFNMELVQEQYHRERRASDDLKNRLKDAASAMKQANGLLEQ